VTLAEIRDEVERHLAVSALAGLSHPAGVAAAYRVGAALLRAHLRPRCTVIWYGDQWLLERIEQGDLIFHRPRSVIRVADFLMALRRGGVRDDPAGGGASVT
jgi:hypothetical protein